MNRFLGVCNVQHASAFGVNVLRIQIYILTYILSYIYTGVSDTYKDNLPLERLDYPSLTDLYR